MKSDWRPRGKQVIVTDFRAVLNPLILLLPELSKEKP